MCIMNNRAYSKKKKRKRGCEQQIFQRSDLLASEWSICSILTFKKERIQLEWPEQLHVQNQIAKNQPKEFCQPPIKVSFVRDKPYHHQDFLLLTKTTLLARSDVFLASTNSTLILQRYLLM